MPEEQGRVPGETAMRCQEMAAGTGGLGQAIVQAILTTGAAVMGKLGANSGVDIGDVTINNIASNPVLSAPFAAMIEGGLVELVGINDQVDQNDYSKEAQFVLGATMSGEILMVMLYSTEDGSGAIQQPDGVLLFFDADPSITVGDTAITAGERLTVIGQIEVETADWQADANGASACVKDAPIAFHALANLYVAWFHEHATSFNDAAGDDEQLEVNIWFRRDS